MGFGLIATASASASSYFDGDLYIGSTNRYSPRATYYVIARDVSTLQSPASNSVSIRYSGLQKNGIAIADLPKDFSMNQNYPNPFNPSTKISYSVPEISNVKISVYDRLGREISTVVNREHQVGYYEANFDASTLASGVYFYTIKAGKFSETRKMTLMK